MITETNIHQSPETQADTLRIAVVMTVFNRRDKTVECLRRVYAQTILGKQVQLEVFLMDDGSSDGTSEAIRKDFPQVSLMQGDGNHFWNGGMHAAFGEALKGDFDFYWWLNDDTFLYEDALERLIKAYQDLSERGEKLSIVIGGTADPENPTVCSYGGFQRASRWTLKLWHVDPDPEQIKACTTMCGNCVFIPKAVSDKTGNIEVFYKHRWGDTDYGLRTRMQGGQVYIAPGFIGTCEPNPLAEKWTDARIPFRDRIKDFHSVKGYIKKDWFFYVRRHGGLLWLLLWMKPYADMIVSSLKFKLTGKAKPRRV